MAQAKQAVKKERKARTPVPTNETKAQRFTRLALQRVPKALKMLDNISKLSGANYEHTPEQVKKITDALEAGVKVVKDKFAGVKQAAAGFTL